VNALGVVQWTPADGVPLCTATGEQINPTITSDGAGGAIITWEDYRSGDPDIYAQRVNALGVVQWTPDDGVALCMANDDQFSPTITSDGADGAIITWEDYRSGNYDIYAQRVNALGVVQWTPADGVALCTAIRNQFSPQITSDGACGAIVTWYDGRNVGIYDIYAQRVDSLGVVRWTPVNGVALCTAAAYQWFPRIASDGVGGAIVTWEDQRDGGADIYAQRLSASGAVRWIPDGVLLSAATGMQRDPTITSDGADGAIVTWRDYRNGSDYDVYAQKVDTLGVVRWTPANGVPICTETGNQTFPTITSDGAGGAIVTWYDSRSGNYDIYAQRIDQYGQSVVLPPDILSVQDVPADQGGWVRITVKKSYFDDEMQPTYPISLYNVWQRIDDPALLVMISQPNGGEAASAQGNEALLKHSVDASSVSTWPIKEWKERSFVNSRELQSTEALPPGTWELLGSFAACQQEEYIYRASTLADSAESGIPYSVYMVSAHTTTPSVWFVSAPDSGYSVDNLPPGPPGGLMAEQSFEPEGLALGWDVNEENDLSYYAVYRGLSEDFVPVAGNRIATPIDPECFDGEWRWNSGYYYKISAVDVHGNESGFVLLGPEDVTGIDTPKVPGASYLAQNCPNPFNPMTKIAFGLAVPGCVNLRIYDVSGRLVRELVDETRPAARYEEVWDGLDGAGRHAASGMYFYRLDAGTFTQTRKMVLLK